MSTSIQKAKIDVKGWATSPARAIARVRHAESRLEFWRRKVHLLRLVVAGDYSPIDTWATPQTDPGEDAKKPRKRPTDLYDVLVTDYTESCSNLMLQSIRTLTMQASARFPEYEFDDMEPDMAQFHQSCLQARLGDRPMGCAVTGHKRLSLVDYMIGGIGVTWDTVRGGKPVSMNLDSLDCIWPQYGGMLPSDWPWFAFRIRLPLFAWIEIYGKDALRELIEARERGKQDDLWLDEEVEFLYYFDVEGMQGSFHCWAVEGGDADKDMCVMSSPNPHYHLANGPPEPFLPTSVVYHLQMPSVKQPIGIAETMLPAQIAVRTAEKRFGDALTRLKPHWDVEEGSYQASELDKMEDGEAYAYIQRNAGKQPMQMLGMSVIEQAVWEYWRANKESLTGMGGANPYASGNRQPDVKFAAETNAIREAAGLMVAAISSDHADDYRQTGFKTLCNMRLYDRSPLRVKFGDQFLSFGPEMPVGQYIDPLSLPKVRDESLTFTNRERKIAEAEAELNVAATLMAEFPNSLSLMYENYLRAVGVKNIGEHLAPPVEAAVQSGQADEKAEAQTA